MIGEPMNAIALMLSNLRIIFLKALYAPYNGNYASIIFIQYLYLTRNFRLVLFFTILSIV